MAHYGSCVKVSCILYELYFIKFSAYSILELLFEGKKIILYIHHGQQAPKACPLCKVGQEHVKKNCSDVTAG